jgi:hypothetical protein
MPEDFGATATMDAPSVSDSGSDFSSASDSSTDLVPSTRGDDGKVHDAVIVDDGDKTAVATRNERPVMNGKLTGTGKTAIEALKQIRPALAQQATQAFLAIDRFKREVPGGFKEIAQLRKTIEDLGGDQGLQQMRSVVDRMEQVDRMYDSADPAFIDAITSDPEGQRSFVALMPKITEKMAQIAPELYAVHNAREFTKFLDAVRFDITLSRITDILVANKESLPQSLIPAFDQIIDLRNTIYASAASRPQNPVQGRNPQEADLEKKQQELTRKEWNNDVSFERRKIFASTYAGLTRNRQVTEEQDAEIKGFYDLAINAALRQRQNNLDRFLANGDREGYLKQEIPYFKKAIPDALRKAVSRVLPAAAAKPTAKSPVQNGAVRPPVSTAKRPDAGGTAVRVARMPANLDPVRTSSQMLRQNRAYGKDGRLYQWA